MPKIKFKPNRSAKKRFEITKNGKIKRSRAGKNHLLQKKSKSTKRNANTPAFATGAIKKNIKQALGV
jgi:large subunit ribosomal protein L35